MTEWIEYVVTQYNGPMNVPVRVSRLPAYVNGIYGAALPKQLEEQIDRFRAERKWVLAFGDVDLEVTDPLGHKLTKADGGNAAFATADLDGDGDNESMALLDAAHFAVGRWEVKASHAGRGGDVKYSLVFYDPERQLLTPLGIDQTLKPGASAGYSFNVAAEPAKP